MNYSKLGSFACAVLFAVGCGDSHVEPVDAAIILPDSGPIDAGSDAGPLPPGSVGSACSSDADCTGDTDVCLADSGGFLPNGYCSRSCIGGAECPAGSTCLQLDRTQAYCFDDCNPGAEVRECREDYGCSPGAPEFPAQVCVGGCTDDTDCATGLQCGRDSGTAGACFDPTAMIGDACEDAEGCQAGGACIDEQFNGWPAGACAGTGCDVVANECDGDAQCLPSNSFDGSGLCIDGCATADDCRDGYACRAPAGYPDRLACQAGCELAADGSSPDCTGGRVCNPSLGTCDEPFDDSGLGAPCSRFSGGCTGGTCLDERTYGHPGGFCAYVGCTVGDDTTCGAGAVCAPGFGERNVCVTECTSSTDCRAGYRCGRVDPTDDTSAGGCLPGCTQTEGMCTGSSRACNVGTGLCTTPLNAAQIGEPCSDADPSTCTGGRCLSEADGWTAGTCAHPGCRLDGSTGPGISCGAAGVCVDDEAGDPGLGYCLDACTVATSGCRPDYECVALDAGTEGACRPVATPPTP